MNKHSIHAIVFALSCAAAAAQVCPGLPEARKAALVDYVRKQYEIQPQAGLRLVDIIPVNTSCYQRLTFRGASSLKSWNLTLYLSPDGRFLTGELLDTGIDPIEERRRKAQAVMSGLTGNKAASRGLENAPVTIVEFSDFQCPFCRQFADIMGEVLPEHKDAVRVVFHHLPLSIHSWARTAAEGAACAQIQGGGAFWGLHDQLFNHQQDITADNIKQKLMLYAQAVREIDLESFKSCLNDQMSLGLVFRDMNLAAENDVQGTPTLFVNGRRISGVRDAAELRRIIADALRESKEERSRTQLESVRHEVRE